MEPLKEGFTKWILDVFAHGGESAVSTVRARQAANDS